MSNEIATENYRFFGPGTSPILGGDEISSPFCSPDWGSLQFWILLDFQEIANVIILMTLAVNIEHRQSDGA